MPDDTHDLIPSTEMVSAVLPIVVAQLPLSLQIFFNDELFKRCQTVANYLADAGGFIAPHLANKPKACFAVVSRALSWRLDVYAVAACAYQTPGGSVGYSGALCQAILENSGRIDGGVHFEHYGDWSKLRGKFQIATSAKGNKYPVATWKPEDEDGLGVKVTALIKGEAHPRALNFDLVQAFPRNSTLWATDPRTQICYAAVRRFANVSVPSLFMGVPFDHDDLTEWTASLKDVTPTRPELREFVAPTAPAADAEVSRETSAAARPARTRRRQAEPEPPAEAEPAHAEPAHAEPAHAEPAEPERPYAFTDLMGEVHEYAEAEAAVEAFAGYLGAADAERNAEALWENGAMLVSALRAHGHDQLAENLHQLRVQMMAMLDEADHRAEADRPGPAWRQEGAPGAPEDAPPEDALPEDAPEMPPEPEPPEPAAASGFDVGAPMPPAMSAQAWFPRARAKLREMAAANCPGADYRRYREVNAVALSRLKTELSSWHATIDKLIRDGQDGRLSV